MALSRTIQKAVDTAFNAAGDLKKLGKLVGPTISEYDLVLGEVVSSKNKNKTVDVILLENTKEDEDTVVFSAIIKSGVDLTIYDEMVIENVTYRIQSSPIKDNNFIIEFNLTREK